MAGTTTLYGISGVAFNQGDRKADMVNLYNNVLSKKNSKLRHIYDEIKSGAKGDICPLCEQNVVKTLDHYLEKADYPIFAVSPLNLVPCCADCNKVKALASASGPNEQTFHPYFDNANDQVWLHATVLQSDPVVIGYTAMRPAAWNALKQDRIQAHFAVLGLSQLYTTHAAVELSQIRSSLVTVDESQGMSGLQTYLTEQANSRSAFNPNSWQSALYACLSTSPWFCAGGYKYVARP
jgi:hypothetical protein